MEIIPEGDTRDPLQTSHNAGHIDITMGGDDMLGAYEVQELVVVLPVCVARDMQLIKDPHACHPGTGLKQIALPAVHRIRDHFG